MKDVIQDALDDLASNKSSTARQGRALDKLEHLIAEICVTAGTSTTEALQSFVSLQETFECNIPFRLLVWISGCLSVLSAFSSKQSTTNHDAELTIISTQIAQALSIIQGTALIHAGSKRYLGRRYPLEVLVDLFYSSRRVPPVPTSVSTNLSVPSPTSAYRKNLKGPTPTSMPLANIVLDTLLCILVDAPSSLRVFEGVNGVHTLVKMFKRAATPREVRMRCIEFLYFYLMDESPHGQSPQDSQTHSHSSSLSSDQVIPTAPNSPVHPSSQHRSALSVSQLSDSSVSSFDSYTTTSSVASISTKATSVSSRSSSKLNSSAPASPLAPSPNISEKPSHSRSGSVQLRPLSLLRATEQSKPLNPKNAQSKLGVGTPRHPNRAKLQRIDTNVFSSDETEHEDSGNSTSSLAGRLEDLQLQTPRQLVPRIQTSSLGQIATPATPMYSSAHRPTGHRRAQSSIEVGSIQVTSPTPPKPVKSPPMSPSSAFPLSPTGSSASGARELSASKVPPPAQRDVRTMQEKKAFLGTMLGNVDALVESIQKAGILGLT
ncbi:cell division control protein 14, SIN component-domain-containing protein [Irpex rosettiformis]|uniref:Cell division control protein 14, SIN component-domain-containing protein n=1 Tax=Irpex rosettiformis TaxID=378272 RepID=A0ACB8UDM1_9APHY|nr:cell division control protein 14, SIN component-domain-containing protein [Irpex rosettiformis]